MTIFTRKTMNLVLNRRAITWASALYLARIHWRKVDILLDELVCGLIGKGDMAGEFGVSLSAESEKKREQADHRLAAPLALPS